MSKFNCKQCPAYQNVCESSNQDECCQALNENLTKAVVENCHSLQKLKAEIAALERSTRNSTFGDIICGRINVSERLRQLSV